ncbi:transmembrane 9 superfamily member 5-like isoform X1 [Salvia miltiorrhiza]|uniref:transmembrane 9 superfamily member 5-like isoform X1 n=1 Tax=Salvia miltiorrhiza TaxID=226208 RepID=UPI0025ACFAB8|nr:transmembrane 9 superfamily member 5-like isoform X1 [Salvia miltiorrhiza]
MGILKSAFVTALLLLLPITLDCANTYNAGDRVPLFVNKIGPLHNPSETYEYYKLAFCRPDQVIEKKESFGEVLGGDRLANALYDLRFALNKTRDAVCQKKLTKGDIAKFRDAIANDFYYQMYYDDRPLWAYIGKIEDESWKVDGKEKKFLLFTHVHFDALYNGNQVIEINAFSEPSHLVDVTEDVDVEVEFTYSISWKRTSMPYKNRMGKYARASLLHILQQSHWFSFVNSIIIVILLIGLLTLLLLQHLKNDLRKWSIGDEDEEKEVGWKYIHGDVFRCPTNLPLFSAVLGCGAQLLTMICILFILAFLGVFQPYSRGSLSSYVFISYILTSAIAGYRSASFCSHYAETGWEKSLLLAGILFLGPLLFTSFMLNILAASFGVTAALPLGTICVIVLVYILVSVPLFVLGGLFGHRYKSASPSSPVTNKCPREIPPLAWYRQTPAQMFFAGLLPFSAIALELHHLYATIWGYKVYSSPGVLFFMFLVLILITITLSVGLTYFQLAVEDHEWWWRSVMRGGSTAIFMFCYCIYFYLQSNMSGLLQTAFFFGYNACICYAFFLMLGAVSLQASLLFIRRIYHAIKSE